jgi:GDP-L-fucose synthase
MAGGDMGTYGASLLHDNVRMDGNVLYCAQKYGATKVVSLLSSFAYPKDASIPLSEKDLHEGSCHPSYEAYGNAKRQLEILSRSYRKQYGLDSITILPTNILGKKKVLRTDGPVVESLIAKAIISLESNTPFVCRGSGKPVRQFCYSEDIAKVILWALDSYSDGAPLNVAGPEISIKELAEQIALLLGLKREVVFDSSYSDGPLKRTVSTEKLRRLWPEFQSTDFIIALKEILRDVNINK